jgi:hypothetical protein
MIMNPYLHRVLLLSSLAAPAWSAPPAAPASLARTIERGLDRCQARQRCDVNPCATNGGLRSCFEAAQAEWNVQTEKIEATLATRDRWCTTYWDALKEKQAAYAEDALTTPALADGPYNTDDDLKVLLAQQRYELAYGVLQNYACRPRKR